MKKSTAKDMTSGNPLKLFTAFMLPLLCGLLFQQFYNMVDTVIVGKFLGVNALAGVGSTGSINFLVIGFCTGICAGFAIPIAQKFGQKDFEGLKVYTANIFLLSAAFSVVLTLLTTLLCKNILRLMNTGEDIFNEAYNYIFYIFLGIPAIILYNMLSCIMRSLGDSKSPVFFLLISSVLNIVLDLLTVTVLGMGVEGPALATVVSQGVSGILCFIYMMKKFDILRLKREDLKIDISAIKILCAMGVPMGLQYSVTAIGSIVLQTAVNGLGTVYVAAVTAGGKVNQLFMCFFDALGATTATFAGQNMGAGKLDRIKKGISASMILGAVFCVIAIVVIIFFGYDIAALFLDATDASIVGDVLKNAEKFLITNGSFYIVLVLLHALRFTIQGLGFSRVAIFAGAFEMLARSSVALLLVPHFAFGAVVFANPAAWFAANLFLVPCYFSVMKSLRLHASAKNKETAEYAEQSA